MIRRLLPGTDHLLSYDGPCDLSVASIHFTNYQISFFSSQKSDIEIILFGSPLIYKRLSIKQSAGDEVDGLLSHSTLNSERPRGLGD